jgi:hypothetical protein
MVRGVYQRSRLRRRRTAKGRMGRECVVRQVGKNGEGECMRNRVVMCIW